MASAWFASTRAVVVACGTDLRDDALAVEFLMTSQQDETGENVRRHHVQFTKELREQLRDLRKRVLPTNQPQTHTSANLNWLGQRRECHLCRVV